MPNYYDFKICGCFLYFTSHCIIEAMHVHASQDRRHSETGSAKFFVREDGSTSVQHKGALSDEEINTVQAFIKKNYQEMYKTWSAYSNQGYYKK